MKAAPLTYSLPTRATKPPTPGSGDKPPRKILLHHMIHIIWILRRTYRTSITYRVHTTDRCLDPSPSRLALPPLTFLLTCLCVDTYVCNQSNQIKSNRIVNCNCKSWSETFIIPSFIYSFMMKEAEISLSFLSTIFPSKTNNKGQLIYLPSMNTKPYHTRYPRYLNTL